MSVLSDEKLRDIYDSKGCHDAGLRAVADAAIAADRAARAETVGMPHKHPAFVSYEFRFKDSPLRWMSCDFAHYRAALEYEECDARALYTAPPAAPVIPQCFMTAESGSGGYRLVMKFQSLVDLHKAHDAMIAMLAAAPAPSQEPTEPSSDQIAAAVKAERERIYALLDSNPEHIWRDAGFMQWRAKRSQESE